MARALVGRSEGASEGLRSLPAIAREEARREFGSAADIELDDWDDDTEVCEIKAQENSAELERIDSEPPKP